MHFTQPYYQNNCEFNFLLNSTLSIFRNVCSMAGDVAQCMVLSSIHQTLGLIPSTTRKKEEERGGRGINVLVAYTNAKEYKH